jgi:hypothetical protein
MPKKIRLGIWIGRRYDSLISVHRVASRINDNYECRRGIQSDIKEIIAFAKKSVPTVGYTKFDALVELSYLRTKRIQVLCSILTPNFLHFSDVYVNLSKRFSCCCEKPGTSLEEWVTQSLVKEAGTVFLHCPIQTVVRSNAEMIERGFG